MATINPKALIRQLFPTSRRLLVERDIKNCSCNDYRRVLVVGAGHDPYRNSFPAAEQYVALDILPVQGITDVVADATSLPLDDNSFDCVAAFEVMEHLENPIRLIEEAYRVLTPGGVLLLSVPFAFHQHADPSDYWRPTRYTLEQATSEFETSDVFSQGNRLHVISDLITTAFAPRSVLWPLRIFNHLLVLVFGKSLVRGNRGTSPSGFFVIARK
jgi:SAM-dependent methyltransferase